ncbi:threonine--tRNA ligase [Dissulfurirhabdus thermomarina]|uniref:Threonine--tRNA ligase n=1 Tax=Dissulfurirhabdus thermomarina TaxID=1765737 RepID=A0A6N9TJM2_DISTH|nr:threonine--tRNA ligase [Dissulfurirhabdus thermomarina]NMX23745.1 threonine--tRNA ligase [Dissulfurirhabdus thermomarina]
MTVTLPDGARREIPAGTPAGRLLEEALGPKRAKRLVLARVDGELRDLAAPLHDGAAVEGVFAGDEAALETLRHTAAHVLAQAVQELFPGTKLGIGPAIENGFYYDFDRETPFTPEDLERIEERMAEIIRAGEPVTRRDLSMDEARRFFAGRGEAYKLELLDDLAREGHESVSVYEQGGFADLCRGPHLPHTGHVAAVRLLHTAGAYWRGDEKRPMLQRIYGTAFFDAKALKRHLKHLEEARKRDHRRLGKELDLFSIQDEVGPGLILWHPRGAALRRAIEDFWREEHRRRGYGMLFTPHIARRDLWKTSGHLDFYAESMYAPMEIDEVRYQIKPMNCPFHIAVYNSRRRSYRELPLRWCELGTVYRYERTGTLHGLMRVRGFTQDDAHVFCRPDQLEGEIDAILDMTLYMLRVFGFDRYDIYLSTRPEKYVGTEDNWERATGALRSALERRGLAFEVDPGEGVFYGPKIDIKIRDCLDRSWQCSTIQVDFNLPERFEVRYAGEDSRPHAPIMIHRALLGSLERFIGVLIEHYAGAFPLWLAPVQCRVLTVTDRHDAWAAEVAERLTAAGFRAETDLRNEKLGRKIRDAQVEKVPYMLVVGDRETADRTVSPRRHKGETLEALSLDEFVSLLETECRRPFTEAAAA